MKKVTVWEMNGVMNAGGTESLIMEIFRNSLSRVKYILVVHVENDIAKGIYDDEIRLLGVPIHYLPSVGSGGIREYIRAFQKLVQKIGTPDVIHCHLNAVSGVIVLAAKKAGIKCRIIHCHADITYKGSFICRMVNETKLAIMKILVNRYGNYYWACSSRAANRLFYYNKKKTVIPNVISVEKYLHTDKKYKEEREALGIETDVVVIGSIGRIARIKNYEVLIQSVAEMRRCNKNILLICYGRIVDQEYYDSLVHLMQECRVGNAVRFMGNSQQIYSAISAFDVFVMPSLTEGFGVAALEAQAAGLQTLVSTGVPREIDMGLQLVQYIDPHTVTDWVTAIENHCKNRPSKEVIIQAFENNGYSAANAVKEIENKFIEMAGK